MWVWVSVCERKRCVLVWVRPLLVSVPPFLLVGVLAFGRLRLARCCWPSFLVAVWGLLWLFVLLSVLLLVLLLFARFLAVVPFRLACLFLVVFALVCLCAVLLGCLAGLSRCESFFFLSFGGVPCSLLSLFVFSFLLLLCVLCSLVLSTGLFLAFWVLFLLVGLLSSLTFVAAGSGVKCVYGVVLFLFLLFLCGRLGLLLCMVVEISAWRVRPLESDLALSRSLL